MIPRFDSNGNLPKGVHRAKLEDIIKRFGGAGYGVRLTRTTSLKNFVDTASPYIQAIYIDGSYITTKLAPGDVDLAVIVRDDISQISDGMKQLSLFQAMFKGDLHIYYFKNGSVPLADMVKFWTKDRDGHLKFIVYLEVKK